MSFHAQLQMNEQRLAGVKAAIEELVRLRNELVHHFIERFDIWTNAGCEAALQHLHTSYATIDRHFSDLRDWARHMDEAREAYLSIAQTPAFVDLLVNGIAPDGTVSWEAAGIVRALREALVKNSGDGWLRLETAQRWMALKYPEQTPERYTCKSWQQVLHESRQFRIEYRLEGERRVPWYRELG
jgi:hypothetical protein